MSKVFHGGYRLIDLGGVDLASAGSGVVVAGIYDACVGLDLKKRVVLTNLKVSGVLKNEVEAQLSKSGDDFVIPGIYGYTLTIKKSDGKVYSQEDISAIAEELADKFVRKMPAPSSTTLTDEYINAIEEGVFFEGNFLGFKNPVLYPFVTASSTDRLGIIIGQEQTDYPNFKFAIYSIDSSKVITISRTFLSQNVGASYALSLPGRWTIGEDDTANCEINGMGWPRNSNNGNVIVGWKNKVASFIPNPTLNIAPEFSDASTYALNALVIHEGLLYKCTTAVETAGAFDATKWTQTTIAEVIASL